MAASQDEWLNNWLFDAPDSSRTSYYLLLDDDAYGYASSVKDEDAYKFRVDIGSTYRITAYDSTRFGNSDTFFYLLDRYGNIVNYGPDYGTYSQLEFTATDTFYYILTHSPSAGYYRLRAENLSISETVGIGESIAINQVYTAALDCKSDSDHFSFSVIAGHSYAVSFTSAIQDLTLRVTDSGPYLPVGINIISPGVYTFDAVTTGIYELSTFSYSQVYTGDYSLQLQDANCKPQFAADHPLDGVASLIEGGVPVILDGDVVITDVELDALNNYAGASLKLVRHGGTSSDDLFSGAGIVAGQASGDVSLSNTVIGSYSWIGGTLLITFNDQATQTLVNQCLIELAYNNASDYPPASVQIDWTFSDGNSGSQGLGGARTATGSSTVQITPVNDAPTAANQALIAEYNTGYVFTLNSFGFSDIDHNNLAAIKVCSVPQAGHLICNSVVLVVGDVVTAADIAAGKFSFVPEPGVVASNYASFDFQVQDDGGTANGGVDWSVATYTATFDVKQVNHAPSGTDATISLEQSGTYVFSLADFGFSDKDNNAFAGVLFNSTPMAGKLYLIRDLADPTIKDAVYRNNEIAAADIAAGKLIFEPEKGFTGSPYASFYFQVRDDGGILDGGHDLDPTPNIITFDVTPAVPLTKLGTDGVDTLLGGAGNDTLVGYGGLDVLRGDEGSDQYVITQASDHTGAEITDTGMGRLDVDTLWFTATKASTLLLYAGDTGLEEVKLGTGALVGEQYGLTQGGNIANSINASALNYGVHLFGNDAANTLRGGSGNDVLDGGLGADKLYGGAGSDTYRVELTLAGVLADTISESANAGFDSVVVSGSSTNTAYKKLNLANNLENLDISQTGTSLLNLFGNAAFNTLIGNAADNWIDGGASGDDMLGGAGNDTYVVDNPDDWVYETTTLDNHVDAGGIDQVRVAIAAANGSYTLREFVENAILINQVAFDLEGNDLSNTLIGNKAANRLNGEGGDDVLTGGLGIDTFVVDSGQDTITDLGLGGGDNLVVTQDAVAYVTIAAAWTATAATHNLGTVVIKTSGKAVNLQAASAVVTVPGNPDPITLPALGYNVTNNGAATSLIGSALDDTLIGGVGNDTLNGGDGNDVLIGGKGADRLTGGGGRDVFRFADADASQVTMDNITDLAIGTGVHGDWIDYTRALSIGGSNALADKDHASIDMVTGIATFAPGEGLTLVDAINDVVNSFALASPQEGNFAFFKVNRSGSYYLLIAGSTGNLLIQLAGVMDIGAIVLSGGDLSVTSINQTLYGGNDNDVLVGGAGDDVLIGGAGNDTLTGGLGADSFIVTEGQDTITDLGLGGVDILNVALGASVNVTVAANWTATLDTINDGTVWINSAGKNVDLSAAGGTIGFMLFNDGVAATLTGSGWADTLTGGKGNDVLNGGAGDDFLIGGKGQDSLRGGAGADTFQFAAGDAGVTATTLDKIMDYQVGDLIDYAFALQVGGSNAAAKSNQAAIDPLSGIATFAAGSGLTLADAVSDIANSFSAAPVPDHAGNFALFQLAGSGDYYLYISDGKKGASAQDVLIQLVGVSSISSIDSSSGDLSISI